MASTDGNQTMKQWQFTKGGSPRNILTMAEVPIPTTCGDGEVLIKISHVSLNPAFMYRLMAYYGLHDPPGAFLGKPCVPEMDFSGIVCDLRGANVKEFKTGTMPYLCMLFPLFHYFSIGDRVFGLCPPRFGDFRRGALREYVLAAHDHIFKMPDNISLKDAACFPATCIYVCQHHRRRI
jgi:NADPH:quinone reductase-like Zn-dependent oxidoreductase